MALFVLPLLMMPRVGRAQNARELWRENHFSANELNNPAVSGFDADPDGDAICNLLEYAFGSDPQGTDPSVLPALGYDADGHLLFCFRWSMAASDLIYFVESSSDLQSWNAADPQLEVISVATDNPGYAVITVRDDTTVGSNSLTRFLRLAVLVRGALGTDGTADDWKLATFGTTQANTSAVNSAGVPLYEAANPLDPNSPALTVTITNPISGTSVP